MQWDRLFEDLEGQLASEWEAERAALDAESERLRIARLGLHSRLRALCGIGAEVTMDLTGGRRLPVALHTLGADWIAAASRTAAGVQRTPSTLLMPLHAVRGMTLDHGLVLASLEESTASDRSLRERMTLGFVLRDLARRRIPVHVSTLDGDEVHGTIDRAAADHLDIAVHDAGDARRAAAVHAFRIIPFSCVVAVRTAGTQVP